LQAELFRLNVGIALTGTCSHGMMTCSDSRWPNTGSAMASLSNTTEAPQSTVFGQQVARFQRAVGAERMALRAVIVRSIVSAEPSADEQIEIVLQVPLESARPGRLDDAVDILAETGPVLERFVGGTLARSDGADRDEDYWYVLIRALGKSKSEMVRSHFESLWNQSPEAVVEALGDLGDAESLRRLQEIAGGDAPEFIRRLASETLRDCQP
jgi:hypothetical protein